MSYLLVVVVAALVAYMTRQFAGGLDDNQMIADLGAGVGGALVVVVIARLMGVSTGYLLTIIVTAIGASASVFAIRYFMKPKPVPVRARTRR